MFTTACGAADDEQWGALAGAVEGSDGGERPLQPETSGPRDGHTGGDGSDGGERPRHPQTTGPRDCEPIRGTFTNQFIVGPPCPPPLHVCTSGLLSGDLEGSYAFNFLSQERAGDSTRVSKFTGESLITLEVGTISGQDFGTLRVTRPPRLAAFTTHLTVTDGSGAFEGASGHLTIQGHANFGTGEGAGTYVGFVCVPK